VIGPARSARAAAWAAQPTRELLGRAAILVDPNDPHDLALKMRALTEDETLRTVMAGRCYARGRQCVDPGFLRRRYLHVYGKVLARAAGA
jgi:glycosyltransferase involved in cell wall biosynthesis